MGAWAVFGVTSSARNPVDAPSRLKGGEAESPIRSSHRQSWTGEAERCSHCDCHSCEISSCRSAVC
eukprot:5030292-Pyramimonas_sp.AAC.1